MAESCRPPASEDSWHADGVVGIQLSTDPDLERACELLFKEPSREYAMLGFRCIEASPRIVQKLREAGVAFKEVDVDYYLFSGDREAKEYRRRCVANLLGDGNP